MRNDDDEKIYDDGHRDNKAVNALPLCSEDTRTRGQGHAGSFER